MKRIAVMLAAVALWAAAARAQSTTFEFTLVPGADLFGSPGELVGWGYGITNNDSFEWLLIDTMNPIDSFAFGTFDAANFMPLLIGPGAYEQSLFAAGTDGLGEFTIDPGAPLGLLNQGSFEVTGTWYTDKPGSDFCPTFDCLDFFATQGSSQADYSVTATPLATPEPGEFLLVGGGLVAVGLRKRRRGK